SRVVTRRQLVAALEVAEHVERLVARSPAALVGLFDAQHAREERARLTETLHRVHAGPEMQTGEVALEDRLVPRDVPRSPEARRVAALVGADGVDHQERAPVRYEPLDHVGTQLEIDLRAHAATP